MPVDCLSASELFTEKAGIRALFAGPGTRGKITLNTLEAVTIE